MIASTLHLFILAGVELSPMSVKTELPRAHVDAIVTLLDSELIIEKRGKISTTLKGRQYLIECRSTLNKGL